MQLTRTGSVAASLRQSQSRKEESPFAVVNMKTSRRMSKVRVNSIVQLVTKLCATTVQHCNLERFKMVFLLHLPLNWLGKWNGNSGEF